MEQIHSLLCSSCLPKPSMHTATMQQPRAACWLDGHCGPNPPQQWQHSEMQTWQLCISTAQHSRAEPSPQGCRAGSLLTAASTSCSPAPCIPTATANAPRCYHMHKQEEEGERTRSHTCFRKEKPCIRLLQSSEGQKCRSYLSQPAAQQGRAAVQDSRAAMQGSDAEQQHSRAAMQHGRAAVQCSPELQQCHHPPAQPQQAATAATHHCNLLARVFLFSF